MEKLNLTPLEMFLKNETNPLDCSRSISNLIEFTTVLYMIGLDEKKLNDELFNIVVPEMSTSIYFINEVRKEILKIDADFNFDKMDELIQEWEPENLSETFGDLSARINEMINMIICSEDFIGRLNSLMRPEYFESLLVLTKLSQIMAEIAKANKTLLNNLYTT